MEEFPEYSYVSRAQYCEKAYLNPGKTGIRITLYIIAVDSDILIGSSTNADPTRLTETGGMWTYFELMNTGVFVAEYFKTPFQH
jgi:hypothetical protein